MDAVGWTSQNERSGIEVGLIDYSPYCLIIEVEIIPVALGTFVSIIFVISRPKEDGRMAFQASNLVSDFKFDAKS